MESRGIDTNTWYILRMNHTVVLYLECCRFRRIGKMMSKLFGKNYRYQTTMNWIKKAGLKAVIAGVDELYMYIKKRAKNTGLDGGR